MALRIVAPPPIECTKSMWSFMPTSWQHGKDYHAQRPRPIAPLSRVLVVGMGEFRSIFRPRVGVSDGRKIGSFRVFRG